MSFCTSCFGSAFGTAAVAACFASRFAYANPVGPAVVGGQASFATRGNVLTVTNREYVFATRDEYRSVVDERLSAFLLEPSARNTAPAIAMAALYVQAHHGADAVMLILPADHVVEPPAAFAAALAAESRSWEAVVKASGARID